MKQDTLKQLVAAANRAVTPPHRDRLIHPAAQAGQHSRDPGDVRFELYHAAGSLCSHKVRTTLAEKGLSYRSHDISMMMERSAPGNYQPEYIRLRLAAESAGDMVSGFTGRSAVDSEGFDPAVVPTLVDHEASKVIIDSARICEYLNQQGTQGPELRPAALSEEVDRLMAIVDAAPHVALLYGADPRQDRRPKMVSKRLGGIHAKKIHWLNKMKAQVQNEPSLLAAYDAKIAKEAAAQAFIANPKEMAPIIDEMRDGVLQLEAALAEHGKDWACGDTFTLADIVWATSLFRMRWAGIGYLFEPGSDCPHVAAYAERVLSRPSFRTAVAEWPGAYAPTPHVPEMNTLMYKLRFFGPILLGR